MGLGWGLHYRSYCPQDFWVGVCSAGSVGEQAVRVPCGSTRTPCPAVVVIAAVGSMCSGLAPPIYQEDGAGSVNHSKLVEIDYLR